MIGRQCSMPSAVESKPIEHCDFVDPQGHYWRSPYKTHKNMDYIQIKIYSQSSTK